jgi:hypothetical protein
MDAIMMNEAFVHDYQEMMRALEAIIAEYPPDMREALRTYAADVMNERLYQMWRERLRERLLHEEWELGDRPDSAGGNRPLQ